MTSTAEPDPRWNHLVDFVVALASGRGHPKSAAAPRPARPADRAGQPEPAQRSTLALAQSDRSTPAPGVLVLDLDGFQTVNDSYGHPVGDLLLIEVAHRLQAVARETDTVARLGGDEFAVLLIAAPQQVREVVNRVLLALQQPVDVAGHTFWIAARWGSGRLPKAPRERCT